MGERKTVKGERKNAKKKKTVILEKALGKE